MALSQPTGEAWDTARASMKQIMVDGDPTGERAADVHRLVGRLVAGNPFDEAILRFAGNIATAMGEVRSKGAMSTATGFELLGQLDRLRARQLVASISD